MIIISINKTLISGNTIKFTKNRIVNGGLRSLFPYSRIQNEIIFRRILMFMTRKINNAIHYNRTIDHFRFLLLNYL